MKSIQSHIINTHGQSQIYLSPEAQILSTMLTIYGVQITVFEDEDNYPQCERFFFVQNYIGQLPYEYQQRSPKFIGWFKEPNTNQPVHLFEVSK